MTRTQAIGEFVASVTDAPISRAVERRVALHVLDTVASAVACRELDAAVVARRYVASRSGTPVPAVRSAAVLGTAQRAPLADAAFAGAMAAHAAEINDFIPSVFVQPGPAIVAAALATAEATGAGLVSVIRSVAAGFEIAARLPRAVGSANLSKSGLASHGVAPCFGAAVAVSALLGLSAEQVGHVLSLTAQQAAGSWQWLLDVEHVEKAFVFAGLGARNGTEAALLVEAGYRGVADVVDRPGTWFTSTAFAQGDGNLDRLTHELGQRWSIGDVAFKRYPVGGPAQPAVEALLWLCGRVDATQVDRVVIEMPGRVDAFRDAAMPALNLRYLASIVLIGKSLDFVAAQSLTRMHDDGEVARLMARVEVVHDPSQESPPGSARTESARVTITTDDGNSVTRFVPHVLGFPSHPMSEDDVEAKAVELLAPHIGLADAGRLIEMCAAPSAVAAAEVVALAGRTAAVAHA